MNYDPSKYGEALIAAMREERTRHPWLALVRPLFPGWRERLLRRAVLKAGPPKLLP